VAAGPEVAAHQKQLGDKPGNDHLQQWNSIAQNFDQSITGWRQNTKANHQQET
jgi:hypothetical protein